MEVHGELDVAVRDLHIVLCRKSFESRTFILQGYYSRSERKLLGKILIRRRRGKTG